MRIDRASVGANRCVSMPIGAHTRGARTPASARGSPVQISARARWSCPGPCRRPDSPAPHSARRATRESRPAGRDAASPAASRGSAPDTTRSRGTARPSRERRHRPRTAPLRLSTAPARSPPADGCAARRPCERPGRRRKDPATAVGAAASGRCTGLCRSR